MTSLRELPLHQSVLHGKEKEPQTHKLVTLMMQAFRGSNKKFGIQLEDGWKHFDFSSDKNWNELIWEHISFRKTIGVIPKDERNEIYFMVIDIDDHSPNYDKFAEYELIQYKVLPIMHFYRKLGIHDNQMLIDNTKAGFHIVMKTDNPISAKLAVSFLKLAANEYECEIFPANDSDTTDGKPIRLPLGIHRVRFNEGLDNAVSHLCKLENGMIVNAPCDEALCILENWKSLEERQVLSATDQFVEYEFENISETVLSDNLSKIRDNETRACIQCLLTYPSKTKFRGQGAFCFGQYMNMILLLEKEDVIKNMTEWDQKLTSPVRLPYEIKYNIKGVFDDRYQKWPMCGLNPTFVSLCATHNLKSTCVYNKREKYPITNRRLFALIMRQKRAEFKILKALMVIGHLKGEHPYRSGGWFRTDASEICAMAKISHSTLKNKIPSGDDAGKYRLDVLSDWGCIQVEKTNGRKFYWAKTEPETALWEILNTLGYGTEL